MGFECGERKKTRQRGVVCQRHRIYVYPCIFYLHIKHNWEVKWYQFKYLHPGMMLLLLFLSIFFNKCCCCCLYVSFYTRTFAFVYKTEFNTQNVDEIPCSYYQQTPIMPKENGTGKIRRENVEHSKIHKHRTMSCICKIANKHKGAKKRMYISW